MHSMLQSGLESTVIIYHSNTIWWEDDAECDARRNWILSTDLFISRNSTVCMFCFNSFNISLTQANIYIYMNDVKILFMDILHLRMILVYRVLK